MRRRLSSRGHLRISRPGWSWQHRPRLLLVPDGEVRGQVDHGSNVPRRWAAAIAVRSAPSPRSLGTRRQRAGTAPALSPHQLFPKRQAAFLASSLRSEVTGRRSLHRLPLPNSVSLISRSSQPDGSFQTRASNHPQTSFSTPGVSRERFSPRCSCSCRRGSAMHALGRPIDTRLHYPHCTTSFPGVSALPCMSSRTYL
jgi:hypothetical protein